MSFSIRHSNDVEDIIDISWREARSKTEVLIFEIGKMDDLMPLAQAEEIRQAIKDNKIRIRQLSNYKIIGHFTNVEGYSSLNNRKYISDEIFKVSSEIVIFEDTVAIYRTRPSVTYLEINDSGYADMMRSLFDSVWKVSDTMIMVSEKGNKPRQYMPISTTFKLDSNSTPFIIYPANGDNNRIIESFDRYDKGCIERYIKECIEHHKDRFKNAEMVVAYTWGFDGFRLCDFWIVSSNKLDKESGFLYDAVTIKECEIVNDMGVASGDSNIVITAEELLLRDLVLEKGLSFTEAADRVKYMPKFPPGMKPSEEFYL